MRNNSRKPFLHLLLLIFIQVTLSTNAQTKYFISESMGSDSNSGTSEQSAWKSIEKVNNTAFETGDSIFFKRNDLWRYPLFTASKNGATNLYFGAYGEGDFPILTVSKNMNTINDWISTGNNLWVCNHKFITDVGNIIFDNETSVGYKRMNPDLVESQDDFYYNLNNDSLYVYSIQNPAQKHSEIECAIRYDVIDISHSDFVTIENLALKYSAAHGIGGTECSNINIRHCEISWIGGGDLDLDGQRRYGNGIEFWANASNCIVEGNKIWEIFDTGVTNQSYPICTQENIIYRNNVIWNCGLAALEIWNANEASVTHNIRFENNTCYNMGKGWGAQRPDPLGVFYAEFPNEAQCDSIFIQNNIFMNPLRFFYAFQNTEKFNNITLDHNCYWPNNAADTFSINYVLGEVTQVQDFSSHQNYNDQNSFFNDPKFTNPEFFDFHLKDDSPCIDMGENIDNPIDHDKNKRPQLSTIDIGAYEFLAPVIINENNFSDYSIYPNPTRNYFSINCDQINADPIQVKIYNLWGELVYTNRFSKNITIKPNLKTGQYIIQIINNKAAILEHLFIIN